MAEAEGTTYAERLRYGIEGLTPTERRRLELQAAVHIESLEKQRDEARAKAIEECAGIAGGYYSEDNECSKAIRALNASR